MRNRFGPGLVLGILLSIAVAIIGGYVFITSGMMPANADARPGHLETWAAKTSLNVTVKREMPQGPVPVALTDQNLQSGIKLYAQNCAVCHGVASGDPTNIAKGFYQRAPQLGKHGVEDDPEGETYWKITHGIRFTAMPAFSKTLNDQQRWELTLFLKHMDSLPPAPDAAWKTLKAS
jgi:mono/diheme cytochrome c family protein